MLAIELHGFDLLDPNRVHIENVPKPRVGKFDSRYRSELFFLLQRAIEDDLRKVYFYNDIVIDKINSECWRLSSRPDPFIRIYDTDQARVSEVVSILQKFLSVGIQVVLIHKSLAAKVSPE